MVQHKGQVVSARPRTEDIQISEDVSFKSMLLPKPILRGLKKAGYITPSPIQQKALPLVRCGLDLIVQAKAGTGKTCVFTVAALEMVRPELTHLQAIILAPTREVAQQITEVVRSLGSQVEGLKTSCFVGGYPVKDDEKNSSCHIAVGTPGRMKQLIANSVLKVKHTRLIVLDEADKLMEKVFTADINAIFHQLPRGKQVLVCSATYSPEMIELLGNYMHRGQYVTPQSTVNPTVLIGVRQLVSVLPLHVDRLATLKLKERKLIEILRFVSFNQCLVYSNIHSRAESVCNLLRKEGFGVEWIAGRQQQADRVIALAQLREQRVRILVTTDLTARGIDVENVNLVINLDLPLDHHTYLHRMGRAGRYGSHGMVITIIPAGELEAFRTLVGKIGGTSQSVRCVPEDLKAVDLRTVPDEELEQIYGTVENGEEEACEESDYSTDKGEKLSKESSSSQEKIEGSNAANSSVSMANGGGNSQNAKQSSGSSTDTDEKFSRSSSDSCENLRDLTERKTDEGMICSCGLYEVQQIDLEIITQPSLFAASEKEEYWTEVLPVEISEKRIPLNTKVALIGSKFIRIRSLDRSQEESEISNDDFQFDELVDSWIGSNSLEAIPSLQDFIAMIEKKSVDNFKNDVIGKEKCQEKKENLNIKLDKLKEQLDVYKKKQKKREAFFQRFDSFDVVGWVAVDVQNNILESLNIEDSEIFYFSLKTCPAGKSHIEVQSLTSIKDDKDDVRCFDDHIITFNLEKLNLAFPTSMQDIAEKFKALNEATKAELKASENVTKNVAVSKPITKSLNSTNGLKNTPSKLPSEIKNSKPNGHCKTNGNIKNSQTFAKSKKSSDSKNSNLKNNNEPKPLCNGAKKKQAATNSFKPTTKSSVCENLQKNLESISRKTNNANKNKSKAGISKEFRRSSSSTEDSGPYVDMSKNLMKWQELHDFDESDSETSSESDLLNLSSSQRVRGSYSDTSECSYETSQAIKQKEVLSRISKNKNKKQSEKARKTPQLGTTESYDTVASENSHQHSFKTAKSQNVSFENIPDKDPFQSYKQESHYRGASQLEPNLASVEKSKGKKTRRQKEKSRKKQSEIDNALKEFLETTQTTSQSYHEKSSHRYQSNVPEQRELRQSKSDHKHQKQNVPNYRYSGENLTEPRYSSQYHAYARHLDQYALDHRHFGENTPQDPRSFSHPWDPRNFSQDQRHTSEQRYSGQNVFDPRHFAQNFPDPRSQRKSTRQPHRKMRTDPRILTSNNLFEDWCSTWYAEVRQRAQQLEFAEYISSMTSNL